MAGIKTFVDLVALPASDLNEYLMKQTVMRFTTDSALVANLGAGIRTGGMLAWSDSSQTLFWYEGSGIWKPLESLWKVQTPTLSAPTPLVIGNGSLTCRWRYAGGKVHAEYGFVRGSTTNAGAGTYFFNLPVEAFSINGAKGFGFIRRSPSGEHAIQPIPVSSTAIALLVSASGSRASNTVPAAVATGDTYSFIVTYEPLNGIS
jgi:hypothetical protein